MRHRQGAFTLSASDLAAFLGCHHRTALDMAVATGELAKPFVAEDPLLEALQERGFEHEKRYVDTLRDDGRVIVDARAESFGDRQQKTERAMRDGADVIVQGILTDEQWMGYPDLLHRVETPSALGVWSYEVADTKLSRETRAATILQLGLYSAMLETAQGAPPQHFHVITPDPVTPQQTYRVNDYAAYVRLIRSQLLATIAQNWREVADIHYPEPVDQCLVCRWYGTCATKRRDDDHLSLVAGISRTQRDELVTRNVPTLTALAQSPLPLSFKPKRGSASSYERVREQARLQFESRGLTTPRYDVLAAPAATVTVENVLQPSEPTAPVGLHRLPEPSPGDLFLDLEGDPFAAEGGREYLIGLVSADGSYQAQWAFSESEERVAFEWVMDRISAAITAHPDMHVYHYAPYEPAAFKRLMGRHVTRERELDAMLRAGRFVDLYGVVRQGLRVGVERYSIKNLEPLYDYVRAVPLDQANRYLRAMELGLMTGTARELPAEVHAAVKGYNQDDCVSTLRLRDWLEVVRAEEIAKGVDIPRPVVESGEASDALDAKAQKVEALRARLLDGVPEERSERDATQQARWLMAYLLDYHRREDKATWWEFFRLRELPEEDLMDEREAVAGLTFVQDLGTVKRSVVHRYAYPPQEMELDPGDKVMLQDGKPFGEVVAIDRANRTIDVLKGPSRAGQHPSAMFAFLFIPPDAMEKAMLRIGEQMLREESGVVRALLEARPPALREGAFVPRDDEEALAFAIRAGAQLTSTVLPIQGPPGAGKTYCGSKMICELVRQGKKVGITATSHKVIRNLMDAVAKEAAATGTPVRLGHKVSKKEDAEGMPAHIAAFTENEGARDALDSGDVNVLGGTAWLWSHETLTQSVDVLFVDEAGQMALANVIAVSQAADSVVLLGDPQQLEQPRKGTHPDGVGISALEHILNGHETIPADRGIFLAETWRLSPDICRFTSELFYESRLTSRPGLERQRLNGLEALPASGVALVPVHHEGNRNYSDEEMEAVVLLTQQLTQLGVTWTDGNGISHPMQGKDILVVAPYNSHVTRLTERLAGSEVRVGTVDKFQGQEAPVVIYSMATSRPEDAPRGMEFLYSLNRLNVATSRARCLAVVVASPHLFEPDCHSPRQMKLANALCRYRELVAGV
jgi:predicted RecB family nuclease